MEFIDKSDIMKGIGPDTTADLLEKAHKYFKREGVPGNYKYYYTEAEYKEAKGSKEEYHDPRFKYRKGDEVSFTHKGEVIQGTISDYDYNSVTFKKEYMIDYERDGKDLTMVGISEDLINVGKNTKESADTNKTEKERDSKLVLGHLDFNHDFMIVREGGSIGEGSRDTYFYQYNGTAYKTSDDKDELKELTVTKNKSLSPGEKSYYKIKYKVVPITNSVRKQFLKNKTSD